MLKTLKTIASLFSLESSRSPFFFHGLLHFLWRTTDLFPEPCGYYFRHMIGKRLLGHLGENSRFRDHNIFVNGRNIKIGDNFSSGRYNYFGGGEICIGNDVRMANFIIVETTNHNYMDLTKPIRVQGVIREAVKIEDDVWIGNRVTILPGVRIGRGSVLASGSVVTKDVEPYNVVGGIPAKPLKKRGE